MGATPPPGPGEQGTSISQRLARLKEWLWQRPAAGEPAGETLLRAFLRIVHLFFLKFDRDRIPLRASALTFTIVLSLVPTLALGTAVLKGLGAGNQARQAAHRFIDRLEVQGAGPPAAGLAGEKAGVPDTREKEDGQQGPPAEGLPGHLNRAVDQIFDYVDRTDFAALGAFGVVGLVLAVMTVLGSIESSMNAIWMAEGERPLGRRFMDYLGLMIILPLSVNLALAMEATIQSPELAAWVKKVLPVSGLEGMFLHLLPLFLLAATFSTLYRFLPNTRVHWAPALAGGLFGAVLWILLQGLYISLQVGVARYNAIYGSFATLPLFLLWLQLCWIIFLAGAEMAFACQFWRSCAPDMPQPVPAARLALAFGIMEAAHADFANRRISNRDSLSRTLRQPEQTVGLLLRELNQGGLLRRVEENGGGYVPAAPRENSDPGEIVDLVLGSPLPADLDNPLAGKALQAARAAVAAGKKMPAAKEGGKGPGQEDVSSPSSIAAESSG